MYCGLKNGENTYLQHHYINPQDLRVLNHEGSIADCASIAGLASLAHFRRPDVTLNGNVIQVNHVTLNPIVRSHYESSNVCD
jgi:exosome complex RNA-binding protein Rrp42 (RNase PH superfamily)